MPSADRASVLVELRDTPDVLRLLVDGELLDA
jgi:hypothetical protein